MPSTALPTPVTSPSDKARGGRLLDSPYANGCLVRGGRYRLERTIGKGSFGKVKQAVDLQTGQRVAIKFIAKSTIKKPQHSVRIQREINLTSLLRHGNVVRLLEHFETPTDIVLVQELVAGKDLFDVIVAKGRLTAEEARSVLRQLAQALHYLHAHNVVHRDLKPENVMLSNGDSMGIAKLIDFGFATLYNPMGQLATNCGSPLYAAPEIVRGVKYCGPEVDCWSLGVIVYCMLTGSLPFEEESLKGLYEKICRGDFDLAPLGDDALAKHLLKGLICVQPEQRMTIAQVLQHPWLQCPPQAAALPKTPMIRPPWREDILRRLERDFAIEDARRQLWLPNSPAHSIYGLIQDQMLREEERRRSEQEHRSRSCSPYTKDIVVTDDPWTVVLGPLDRSALDAPHAHQPSPSSQCHQPLQSDRWDRPIIQPTPGAFRPNGPIVMDSERHDGGCIPRILADPLVRNVANPHSPNIQASNGEDEDANGAGNFVLQAAASVMNRFRRLRELAK